MKRYLILLLLVGAAMAQQSIPGEYFLYDIHSGAGTCTAAVGFAGWCLTPDSKLLVSWNGSDFAPPLNSGAGPAAVASVFGRTGTITAQKGDYSFDKISGMIVASQLPATTTCNLSITGLTMDGKGNASGKVTFSSCQ